MLFLLTLHPPVCVQIRSFQKSIQSLSHVLIVLTHLNTSPPESLPRQNGPSLPALLANFNDSPSRVPAPLTRSVCPFMSKEEFFVVWLLCQREGKTHESGDGKIMQKVAKLPSSPPLSPFLLSHPPIYTGRVYFGIAKLITLTSRM